jgi:hypothetical protein
VAASPTNLALSYRRQFAIFDQQYLPRLISTTYKSTIIKMSGFNISDTAKKGWHPKGKDGKSKESWRGDFKGLDQIVSKLSGNLKS